MKLKILYSLAVILILSLAITQQTYAQSEENPTWISIYFGHHEYDGDFGNEMLQFNIPKDPGGGIGISQYLSPSFDLDLSLYLGKLDTDYDDFFEKLMLNGNLTAKYKFTNGYIFKKESAIQPYIFAGAGLSYLYRGKSTIDNGTYVQVPLGIGFDIPLSEKVQIGIKSTYNRTFSDYLDGETNIDNNNHDDFLVHTIGLKFSLGGAQDSDGDGVNDKEDDCPSQIGEIDTNGCPDRDRDGIKDSIDRCSAIPGLVEFAGCADTDLDRIPDYEDECPEIKGTSQFKGCKDTDGDMIADPVDACPAEVGSSATNGCPDNDNDGIRNSEDSCPEIAGTKAGNGCPDTDGDGIIDSQDACPKVAGTTDGNGCPVVSEEILKEINVIFSNLNFASNKATIAPSSLPSLDRLSQIMNEDKALIISIEGHTDSRGNDDYNLQLSRDRALAVKTYLIRKGVVAGRISSTGYGETQPLASNDTADGRNRNRRVELNLSYNK